MDLPWTEKYRPKNLREIVGHEEIVERFEAFVKAKNVPNLLFAGPPGVGKTTVALAMANELYGDVWRESILELNASDERGIDVVRGKIKDFARTIPISDVPFKLVFLDEADSLTPDAQHALRRTMELYSKVTRFVLSCNYSSKIIEPIQSRCAVFRFRRLTKEEIEKMLRRIAEAEKLKLEPKALEALIYVSEGDMRKAINIMQSAAMMKKEITESSILRLASRARPEDISNMIKLALKGKFKDARDVLDNLMLEYGMSGEDVLLQIYREIPSLDIDEKLKVELVDKIGEYNFRLVEGANERIQLEALLAHIMLAGCRR